LPGTSHRNARIIAHDVHSQRARGIGDQHADGAQTEHAQGAARQLETRELLLFRLDRLIEPLVVALQSARVIPRLADIARRDQHARQHQFFNGVGVGARCVKHRDP
jgi:hypothetical protein